MRIAWICSYPASDFPWRPSLEDCRQAVHPVPWVTVQAPLLAAMPGVELHIVTVARDYSADDHFEHNGMHFHFLRVPPVPRALLLYRLDRRRIHQCLRAIAPDLVQGFGTEGSSAYAAVTSGYPAVVFMQGIMGKIVPAMGVRSLIQNPGWMVPLVIERVSVRRGRRFICETQFSAEFVRQLNASAVIDIVKTPVRPEFFAVERLPAPAQRPELLFVGSVLSAKGIELLLTAFANVIEEFPAAILHVVGTCDQRYMDSVLTPLMGRHHLDGNVLFHGIQAAADVSRFMAGASLLVLPTYMDTSPNAVSEAQVAGVPVVASRVGGLPEMIDHGQTGILVPPRSVRALSEAIRCALRNPQATEAMARAARQAARPQHDARTQVTKLMAIYRDMVGHGAVASPQNATRAAHGAG